MATPIVLLGTYANIAEVVKDAMQPEYEVIHTTLSTEAAIAELPALLQGEQPPSTGEVIGTKNYSSPPKAVVIGGYDDESVSKIKAANKGSSVPWLRNDASNSSPAAERVKAVLNKLGAEGKLSEFGEYLY